MAIVGAPMDELVSDRPGTRFAPRAIRAASCPPGPNLETAVDAFAELRVVDYGDAPIFPADPHAPTPPSRRRSGRCSPRARTRYPGWRPFDHRAQRARLRRRAHGPVGLVHFDTHTDTGAEVFGVELSHGTIMRRLVEEGSVDPRRYVQIGLRGYWPGEKEFAWQRERGITSLFMHEVSDLGIKEVMGRAVEAVGEGPVFLTVDIDVLDPAFAPGTGTPEPGGMTTAELLWAVREVARRRRWSGPTWSR